MVASMIIASRFYIIDICTWLIVIYHYYSYYLSMGLGTDDIEQCSNYAWNVYFINEIINETRWRIHYLDGKTSFRFFFFPLILMVIYAQLLVGGKFDMMSNQSITCHWWWKIDSSIGVLFKTRCTIHSYRTVCFFFDKIFIERRYSFFWSLENKIFFLNFRSIMNPPKPSKDKESPGASSSSQVTFVRIYIYI